MKKRLRKKGSSNKTESYPSLDQLPTDDDYATRLLQSLLYDPYSLSHACLHTAVATRKEGALTYVTCGQCNDSIVLNSSSLAHLDLTALGLKKRWQDFPPMDSQTCISPYLVPDHDLKVCEVCSPAAFSSETSKTNGEWTEVDYVNDALPVVELSTPAKKQRGKKACETKVVDGAHDTAPMEVNLSKSAKKKRREEASTTKTEVASVSNGDVITSDGPFLRTADGNILTDRDGNFLLANGYIIEPDVAQKLLTANGQDKVLTTGDENAAPTADGDVLKPEEAQKLLADTGQDELLTTGDENAAPTAVKLSKAAKKKAAKKRRQEAFSDRTKVFDDVQDTAPVEASQSDSVVAVDNVGACSHEVAKLGGLDTVVRIVCQQCTEGSNAPDDCGSGLAIKACDVSTYVASLDDDQNETSSLCTTWHLL